MCGQVARDEVSDSDDERPPTKRAAAAAAAAAAPADDSDEDVPRAKSRPKGRTSSVAFDSTPAPAPKIIDVTCVIGSECLLPAPC